MDSPIGSVGGDYNIDSQGQTAYAVHGVKAEGDTGWFTDAKVVKDALGNAGKLGKALGKIEFGFSKSSMTGQYIQTDSSKNVTDRGIVYARESGASVGFIGKSERVEVKKSLMTGVAIKSTTTKYKFMFVTYEK